MDSPILEKNTELVHLRRLSASLDIMRQNGALTDVTLVCGKKEFLAHRLVLAAVSPYFQSTWGSDWKEATSGRIELPAASAGTTDAILSFAYTGKLKESCITDDNEIMLEILEAADYFQIDSLVDYCFQIFSDRTLTTTNFWEMYVLADKFNNQRHISHIERLLAQNFNDMSQSEDFLCLKEEQLYKLLQHPDVDQSRMDEVFTALLKWTQFESQRSRFLKDMIDILDRCWCSVWLNDLIVKNIALKLWHPETTNLLCEISSVRGTTMMCRQLTNSEQNLVCFSDGDMMSMYNVENNEWLPNKELPFFLNERMATVGHNRHIFLVGGEREIFFEASTTVIQYCPFTNTVADPGLGRLLFPVCDAGAGIFNECIYVVNGVDKNHVALRLVQCYDPKKGSCLQVASTLKWHKRPYVFAFQNCLHIFGPAYDNDKSLERYDPAFDQWTELTEVTGIHEYTVSYQAAFSDTKLYCFSGLNTHSMVHTFDLTTKGKTVSQVFGPDDVCAVWSVKQSEQSFLVAVDRSGTLYFYTTECQSYLMKQEQWNTDQAFYHWLSCCV